MPFITNVLSVISFPELLSFAINALVVSVELILKKPKAKKGSTGGASGNNNKLTAGQVFGLIVKNTQNQWQRTQARLLVNSDSNANADTKKFLIQMLQRAERAIQEQDHSTRITDSETFVISKSKIPELNQLTEEYLKRVVDLAAKETKPEAVFHCQVNLFQVSGLERKK